MEDSGIGIGAAAQQGLSSVDAVAASVQTLPQDSTTGPVTVSSGSSTRSSPMTQSIDDFTHIPLNRMATSISKSQYSQVVFHDVSDTYPTDSDIKCRYTLTSDVTAQPGDKVALFKVGWASVSEYICFERAPQPTDVDANLTVVFKAEKLPKDMYTLYQLGYVTSGNVIAGASTPFNFHKPSESELIAVEDPGDPGMLVFRSRATVLHDNLQKKNEDYDHLLQKHKLLEDSMLILKKELDKTDESLKITNDNVSDLLKVKQSLEIDNKVLEERLFQFQQESDTISKLEDELNKLKLEKEVVDTELIDLRREFETMKHQFEENKKGILALRLEKHDFTATLNKHYDSIQEKDRLIESKTSTIDCLRLDCERLNHSLKEQVKTAEALSALNDTNVAKVRDMAAKLNSAILEKIQLTKDADLNKKTVDFLNKEIEMLRKLLQETFDASDRTIVLGRKFKQLEDEKQMAYAQLKNLEEHHSKCDAKIHNLTSELNTLKIGENKTDSRKSSCSAEPTSRFYEVMASNFSSVGNIGKFFSTESRESNSTQSSPSTSNYPISGVCAPADEIAMKEARDILLQKHLAEVKQDNICKNNRIDVLELELRAAKDELIKMKKHGGGSSTSDIEGLISQHIAALTSGLPIINQFNEQAVVMSHLKETIQSQKTKNAELKQKVEDLLMNDSEMFAELQKITGKYDEVCLEMEKLKKTPYSETIDQLNRALDHSDTTRRNMETELQQEKDQRIKVEQQLTTLRAESVGKISVDCSRKMQEEIHNLQSQLVEMTTFCEYMKRFIHYVYGEPNKKTINCPLCQAEFPSSCCTQFAAHFKDSHMK